MGKIETCGKMLFVLALALQMSGEGRSCENTLRREQQSDKEHVYGRSQTSCFKSRLCLPLVSLDTALLIRLFSGVIVVSLLSLLLCFVCFVFPEAGSLVAKAVLKLHM